MKIYVEKQPDGYFAAYDKNNYDLDSIVGYGKTEQEAIEDLKSEMQECSCFDEEMWLDHKNVL